MCKV